MIRGFPPSMIHLPSEDPPHPGFPCQFPAFMIVLPVHVRPVRDILSVSQASRFPFLPPASNLLLTDTGLAFRIPLSAYHLCLSLMAFCHETTDQGRVPGRQQVLPDGNGNDGSGQGCLILPGC
jgi:hypothetical protein